MKKLLKKAAATSQKYNLVCPGDRILVAFSGGKDSLLLLDVFQYFQKILNNSFTFDVVHLDQGYTTKHCNEIKSTAERKGISIEILDKNQVEIIREFGNKGKNPCSFCARLRRGVLYKYASDKGYNKIALGHHLDDMIETFFLNLFYNGEMRTFLPTYKTKDYNLKIIRPLAFVREEAISQACRDMDYKTYKTDCIFLDQKESKRFEMKGIIEDLSAGNPFFYRSIKHALETYIESRINT